MRAQASVEFLMIFAFLLIVLIVAILISFGKIHEIGQTQIRLEIDAILNEISNKINTVFLEGPGFSTNLTLPKNVAGINYSVRIMSNEILLDINNVTYFKTMLTRNVTQGYLNKAKINLIRNENGEIIIS